MSICAPHTRAHRGAGFLSVCSMARVLCLRDGCSGGLKSIPLRPGRRGCSNGWFCLRRVLLLHSSSRVLNFLVFSDKWPSLLPSRSPGKYVGPCCRQGLSSKGRLAGRVGSSSLMLWAVFSARGQAPGFTSWGPWGSPATALFVNKSGHGSSVFKTFSLLLKTCVCSLTSSVSLISQYLLSTKWGAGYSRH